VPVKLMDIPSAAEFLGGLSVWTIRAWLSQGRLRKTKVGRRTMVSLQELERFIAEQQDKHENATPPNPRQRTEGKFERASLNEQRLSRVHTLGK
jgi:excisionase family DNA binding protein